MLAAVVFGNPVLRDLPEVIFHRYHLSGAAQHLCGDLGISIAGKLSDVGLSDFKCGYHCAGCLLFEDGTKIDVIDLSDETFERIIFKGEAINLSHVELRNILSTMTDVTGGKGYFTELEDPDDWLSKNT